jgi:hypothetical protein
MMKKVKMQARCLNEQMRVPLGIKKMKVLMKITERLLPPQETRKQQLLKKNNLQANRTRRIRLQLPKTKEPQVPKLQQKRLRKIQTLNQLQDARKVRTLRKRNAAPMPKRKQPKLVLSLTHKLKQRRSV